MIYSMLFYLKKTVEVGEKRNRPTMTEHCLSLNVLHIAALVTCYVDGEDV